MAYVTREFTQYLVYYMSGGSASVGVPQDAQIDCFDSSGNRAGAIYFYLGSSKLPQNQETVNGIYLHYRMSRYSDVVHLLQNEKPLYLNLENTSKVGYISTGNEPVGENE